MSAKIDNLRNELRTKVNEADKTAERSGGKRQEHKRESESQCKGAACLDREQDEEAKSRAAAADAKMKSWVEEKKVMTQDKIMQWKEERNEQEARGARRPLEDYAVAAIQFAGAAFDEAERATAEAIIARIDADSVAAPSP